MRIKEKGKNQGFFYYLKKLLILIWKFIMSKKTRIFFKILILIVFLILGFVAGLLIAGFFGTLNNPSPITLEILHSMDISGLSDFKTKIDMMLAENIKIPYNFLIGQFSRPEKIFINIPFKDYQKLEFKRQRALEKAVLLASSEDYVPATISYKDKELNVKLRLKGDWTDHLKGNKWSFRIKIRSDDNLFGMRTFSIQSPKTRNYLYEWIYHKVLKNEDILSLRYYFIEVFINGKNRGIYALEEHFDKDLIGYNQRRAGVIIKFNEDLMWEEISKSKDSFDNKIEWYEQIREKFSEWFITSEIETFDNDKILEDPVLFREFKEAKDLLESFRKGLLKGSEVFDVDKFSKYFAINTLMGCNHASYWNNIRFYYNPITSRLEPIGFDAACGEKAVDVINLYQEEGSFENLVLSDKIIFKKYLKELERISDKQYLDTLLEELDYDINKNLKIIHKDTPSYHFSKETFYKNQEQIKSVLNPIKAVNVYVQEVISNNKLTLSIGNINFIPLEIIDLVYGDSIVFEFIEDNRIISSKSPLEEVTYEKFEFSIPENLVIDNNILLNLKIRYKLYGLEKIYEDEVLPWPYTEENFKENDFIRKKPNINSKNLLSINENSKKIFVKKGSWILNESLIIPKGYEVFFENNTIVDLIEGAAILSYSPVQMYGTEETPIKIISSDKSGQGIAVLNTDKTSNLKHVIFSDLHNPLKEGWELTGAVSFYKSPVIMKKIIFKGNFAEDSLNIINSDFEIRESTFENCFSDCFDDDFSAGIINSSSFTNCGNDCIDISGAKVEIDNVNILNAGDKGVSAGENANLRINNLSINSFENKTYIGIASKDLSEIFIENSDILNTIYGFAVYQKKPEYGPAIIRAFNTTISDVENQYIIERGSDFFVDNVIMITKRDKVYDTLYGNQT